jgi:DNA-binding NarL/FixJ family response regulator
MTEDTSEPPSSILSHEERAVARALAAGEDAASVAGARGTDPETVERAAERVREKTERALATLAESPFVAEALADLDPETRAAVRAALEDGDPANDGP